MRKLYLLICSGICMITLMGCAKAIPVTPKSTQSVEAPVIGMANPASVNCEQQGGKLEIRNNTAGQYGMCIFPDGSECDEWAFYRKECKPGDSKAVPSQVPLSKYTNDAYGFSFNQPDTWTVEESDHSVTFHHQDYALFVGYQWANEQQMPFRTGMPAGDFVDGGTFKLLGQDYPKKMLVFEGKTKVVEYGANIPLNNLRLYIWLDSSGADYAALDIPVEIIAEADQILTSFALTGGGTPYP
jgi:putative hemolysin